MSKCAQTSKGQRTRRGPSKPARLDQSQPGPCQCRPVRTTFDQRSRRKRCSEWRATPRGHDRRGTFRRLLDDDAARSPRTMGTNKRRKNDDHQGGKGGETKPVRRGESSEQRDIHHCIGRGEPICRETSVSADGMPTTCRGNICLPSSARSSGVQSKPSCKECLILKVVTIIDPAQTDVIGKNSDRVISSRLVLRWKETDTAYKAKARWVRARLQRFRHSRDRAQLPDTGGVVYRHHAPDFGAHRVRGHVG